MTIMQISDEAKVKLKERLNMVDTKVVKIGTKGTGCNGHSYYMNPISLGDINKLDERIDIGDGYTVVIDNKSFFHLFGTRMGWEQTKLYGHFVWNNPNVESTCGCGESVNFKD